MKPKGDALHTLLDNGTLPPCICAAHDPTFVIKVAEHDEDASALLAESVLHRNLDVVEGDVCCSSRRGVRSLDRLRLDSRATLDEKDGESVLCKKILAFSFRIKRVQI